MFGQRNACWICVPSRLWGMAISCAFLVLPIVCRAEPDERGGSFLTIPDSRDVRARAEQGQVQQQLMLAAAYFTGRGVQRDLSQAAYWYRKAADQGNPAAQVQIGYFYHEGIGVPRDDVEAARWYMRATASGYSRGKVDLAVLYLGGSGVRKDTHQALQLLHSAAAQHDGAAEAYLGLLTYFGIGMPADPSKAEEWFREGVKHHNAEAEFDLGSLYSVLPGHPRDLPKAEALLRSAAGQGHVLAQHSLGLLLVNHPELPQHPGEATSLLSSAAESGCWQSSIVLAVMARDGKGVPKNLQAAYRWFRIAALQGGEEARQLVASDSAKVQDSISAPDKKVAEDDASAWFQAHPRKDLFRLKDGMRKPYFPIGEVEVTQTTRAPSGDAGTLN